MSLLEPIGTMPAAGFAAIAALEKELRCENVVPVFQVVVFSFDKLRSISH
jgi:hypothetical protein